MIIILITDLYSSQNIQTDTVNILKRDWGWRLSEKNVQIVRIDTSSLQFVSNTIPEQEDRQIDEQTDTQTSRDSKVRTTHMIAR